VSLNISAAADDGETAMDGNYQSLTFNELRHEEFQLISNYKEKNCIKSIDIAVSEREVLNSAPFIQNMLFWFTSLMHISFYVVDEKRGKSSLNEIKFSTLEQPKLESLSVSYEVKKTNVSYLIQ
jgi:hypothetical protein